MKKLYLFLITILFPAVIFAQQQKTLYKSDELARIKALHKEFEKKYADNYDKALLLAKKNNWITYRKTSDGKVIRLIGVDSNNQPIYWSSDDAASAATTRTNALYTGGSLGLNLNGGSDKMKGKFGLWEFAGAPLATHQELAGRIVQKDNATSAEFHATHVAGILMASGVNSDARGMAWGMKDLQSYVVDGGGDISEVTLASPNLLISNHSYGRIAGWRYNSDRTGGGAWEWWGDDNISTTEDYKFGFYDSFSSDLDKICFNAPYYLYVKSVGNTRESNGPTAGTSYFLASGTTTSTLTRRGNGTSDNIPTYANAKNILSVGAVYATQNGIYNSPSDVFLADFSSGGPTDDGRIKPDICGVGVSTFSSSNASNTSYDNLDGTSFSAPNVSGSLFLLQEHYANLKSGTFMKAATLKGLAIHTANEAGPGPGPDYAYGWGLLNTERAAQVITNTGNQHVIREDTLQQGKTFTFQVVASGNGPLRATISWTDPEATATTTTAANLNNRTPKLVNDLDLRISDGNNETLPWILDFNNPASAATRGDNIRDNVEQVLIANPTPGKTYTITIKHKGTLQRGPQVYALIVSGIGGKAYCASAPSATGTVHISNLTFGTINNTSPNACTTYSDFTTLNGNIYYVKQAQNLSVKVSNCNGNQDKVVKIFIDYNSDGDFDDVGELVATSGVINGEITFTTPVVLPANVPIENTLRIRAVVSATNDAATISSCGNFVNGETEDYKFTVIRPTKDAGVTELVTPSASACATPTQNLIIRVQNNGLDTLTNFSINVTIKDGNTVIKTITTTYKFKLPAVTQDDYDLSTFFPTEAGKTYTFIIEVTTPGDQDNANNSLTVTRTITNPTTLPSGLSALICGNDGFLTSTSPASDGTVFWYDALAGGNFLGTGNSVTTSIKPANNTYYAGLNDFRASFGVKDKYVYTKGSYASNFGPQPLITTQIPLVIESARLYIGTSGILRFVVVPWDESEIISEVYIDAIATRNPNTVQDSNTPAGQLTDDPTDQGAVYVLNLKIPKPGNYKIIPQYGTGVSIYRSNESIGTGGRPGFPFTIPGVITMKGSLFQRTATQIDTLKEAYYYFYDMQIKALDCAGPRTAVPATVNADAAPSATVTGGGIFCTAENYSLSFALTGTAPWKLTYNDGTKDTTVTVLTSPYSFKPTKSGIYKVTGLSDAKSCKTFKTSGSATFTLVNSIKATITIVNGFKLTANSGAAYTWYLNGQVIPYITQTITALIAGKYSVEVVGTNPNCPVSRSDEVTITVSANEPDLENGLEISPNPSSGQFVIKVNPAFPIIKGISVKNVLGQTLQTLAVPKGNVREVKVDLTDNSNGIYFLSVETEQKSVVKRLVKQ